MGDSIRLVPAPLQIEFSVATEEAMYEREFQRLSESDDDPIGQWLKIAKAKGETKESDPVLLHLLVELHRKVNQIEQLIQEEVPERIDLDHMAQIEAVGFDHFRLVKPYLKEGELYYGRLAMPVFPKREMGLWFVGVDAALAKITRMHERDEKEWSQYVVARERVLIRKMKGKG